MDGAIYEAKQSILPHVETGAITRHDAEVVISPIGVVGVDGIVDAPAVSDVDFAINIKLRKMWIMVPRKSE